MIIISWDPGSKSNVGAAGWGDHGFLFAEQGTTLEVFREVVRFIVSEQKRDPDFKFEWVIEGAFVGSSAYSSLKCAESIGVIKGMIILRGVRPEFWWEPKASDWRRDLSFPTMVSDVTKPKGRRRAKAKDHALEARRLAEALTGIRFTAKNEHKADAVCIAKAGWNRWNESEIGLKQPSLWT